MDLSQFSWLRVMAILAGLSLVGWLWFAVESNMPRLIFLALCAVAPIALGFILLVWILQAALREQSQPDGTGMQGGS